MVPRRDAPLQSILTNGPLPRATTRKISFAQSRPMFPAAKRVCFRTPLTEEVKNSKYTLRHSDIESSPPPGAPTEVSKSEEEQHTNETETSAASVQPESQRITIASIPQRNKRESEEEDDSDSCPATPVAGRRKRHRQWVWTLDPIKDSSNETISEDNTVIDV